MRGQVSMFVATFCLLAIPTKALADSPASQKELGRPANLKLSGSVRVRYETLDGQVRSGLADTDEQLAIRTILSAEYASGRIRIGGELYDSRAYLGRKGSAISAGDVNALELVQAYVAADIPDIFGPGSKGSLQAGRFTLNLGSRRLVAADEYRNATNGYTGLRFDLQASGTTATLIYVLPQVRLPDDLPSVLDNKVHWDKESLALRLWGGIVSKPAMFGRATGELAFFQLDERDSPTRPTRNRHLGTVSARIVRDPKAGSFDFEVEAARQFGTVRATAAPGAPRLRVNGHFVHADVGYTFPGPAKLRLSMEYDYVSGDGPGTKYRRFDTLFGMRRGDFGPAGIYNAIGRANISTPGIRIELAPSPRWDAFVVGRAMWLASRTDSFSTTGVRDPKGAQGSFAGNQIEGRIRYWLVPKVLRAEVNAVWLGKGRFLRDAPNAPRTGNTRYLATGLTASF